MNEENNGLCHVLLAEPTLMHFAAKNMWSFRFSKSVGIIVSRSDFNQIFIDFEVFCPTQLYRAASAPLYFYMYPTWTDAWGHTMKFNWVTVKILIWPFQNLLQPFCGTVIACLVLSCLLIHNCLSCSLWMDSLMSF